MKQGTKYKRYTEEENQFLRDNYAKMTLTELSQILGRDRKAIGVHAVHIGIPVKQSCVPLNKEELKYIAENSNRVYSEIAHNLNRSPSAIHSALEKLNLGPIVTNSKTFTSEQRSFMIANKENMSYEQIAQIMNRSITSIKRFFWMHRKRTNTQIPTNTWTDEENNILINNYSNTKSDELYKMISTRTPRAIESHVSYLRHRNKVLIPVPSKRLETFSTKHGQWIAENYITKSVKEMAELLDVPIRKVYDCIYDINQKSEIKIHKNASHRLWTKPEIEFLLKNYKIMPTKDIAKKLGLPVAAIYSKAHTVFKKSTE